MLQGELFCANCLTVFYLRDGIPDFLCDLPNETQEEIKSSQGVATFCYPKEPDVYNDEFLLALPYIRNHRVDNFRGWERKVSTFEQVLNDLPAGKGKKLLDIGASTTWATRYFAKKGFDCIALDIVTGMYRGLSSSKVFFRDEGVYYERLLAPMENIPLRPGSIDCIFSINSLHHSAHLKRVFAEISRVLSPGGIGYLIDDTTGFLTRSKNQKEARLAREINQHNDHIYSLSDYKEAISSSNLSLEIMLPMRFLDKIGALRSTPDFFLRIIYLALSRAVGLPFYFRVGKH